jgi:hypothetical protein
LKNVEGGRDEKRDERSIKEEERKDTKRIERIESNRMRESLKAAEGQRRLRKVEDIRDEARGKVHEGREKKGTERGVERM